MLRVEGLCYSASEKENILQDISFKVDNGEMLVITGPNGGGKSTLAKCVNGNRASAKRAYFFRE